MLKFLFMRKAIFRLFLLTNYLFVVLLLLAHMATEVSPERMWFLAFFGIAYPLFVLVNVFFLVLWGLKRKMAFILPLLFLGLNYGYVQNYFPISFQKDNVEQGIKLLSYNVRMFDLYNWTGDKYTSSKAVHYILAEKPDVAFFQEYYSRMDKKNQPTDRFRDELGLKYHIAQTNHWKSREKGLAIFSRFPIQKHAFLKMKKQPFALWADVATGRDTLRLLNVHLQSIHFDYEQYNFIDSLSFKDNKQKRRGALKILRMLKRAFHKRAVQADSLRKFIAESPYPVVLGGDFNDTPSSYAYYQIRCSLKDAFVESGSGIGATYQRINFPFRIDFLLVDSVFQTSNFKLDDVDFSDHRPISCFLKLGS